MAVQTIRPVIRQFAFGDNYIGVGGASSNLATYIDEIILDTSDYIYDDGTGPSTASQSRYLTLPFNLIPASGYITVIASTNYAGRFFSPNLTARKGNSLLSLAVSSTGFETVNNSFTEYSYPFTTNYTNASIAYNNGYSGIIGLVFLASGGLIGDPGIEFDMSVAQTYMTLFGEVPQTSEMTCFISGPVPNSGQTTLYTQGPFPNDSGTTLYAHCEVPSGQCTLHTINSQPSNTGCTLFTKGYLTLASGCDLYINGDFYDDLPLYISGPTVYSASSGVPLFIRTQYSESGNTTNQCTLHTLSKIDASGDVPLTIFGPSLAEVNGNTFPLYISGPVVYNLNNVNGLKPVSLFIANNLSSGNASRTLYVQNSTNTSSSGELPLVLFGGGTDYRSGNIPLYVQNHYDANSGITIYLPGGVNESFLPLSIIGRDYVANTNNIPLFIEAMTNSGITAYTTLFTKSTGRDDSLHLFIKSVNDEDESSDSCILYLHNDTTTSKEISLYINNLNSVSASGVRLYVRGTGENAGWYESHGSLNCYINSGPEGPTKSTTLYLEAVKTASGLPLTLNISGSIMPSKEMTLVIPSTVEDMSKQVSLYNHGF